MEEFEEPDAYNGPRYRRPEDIPQSAIPDALSSLALFGDDPNMRNQAFNLALVDEFVMRLEYELLRKQFVDERTPLPEATFVSAQSQMWIFAAYELIRTWRQRAKDILKLAETGGLHVRLAELRKDQGYTHVGRLWRAGQIERVLASPSSVQKIRDDLRRTYIAFVRMEFIRISLAKHEVRRQKNSVALMPTHGRINRWCGSFDFEMENGSVSLGLISRRDIAEEIRAFSTAGELPNDETIEAFEEFMRATPDEGEWK